ncbi:GAF domain-containing protein [Agromyces sp. C10]|uniref:GAF domain-containing protein n=1 Tax=Agromyces sp. C10 TaxID=2935077 RepID=UPI00200A792B|nr:GAF domain-containing protein [Agromyces sp. C10]MCK8610450.1 GAF domain-containing protein [Agromyces sp. C10]
MRSPGHDPRERDARDLRDRLLRAQEDAIATGVVPLSLRPVVRDSWERAIRGAIDPDRALPTIDLDDDAFRAYRAGHALAPVMPVIRRLLVEGADDAGLVVAVGDAQGRLLWVEGDPHLRRRAEDMLFVAGADWSESSVGTSAPGTALQLDRPVQIRGAEHYNRIVHPWSCTAAPVHDPATGALLGVIDITGTDLAVAPHALSLVSATVAAVEAELRIANLETAVHATIRRSRLRAVPAPSRTALTVLGERRPRLGDVELSPRHAEILTLLAWHPSGLGAERLAALVYEGDPSPVTLRAEIARLRRVLEAAGEPPLESRPYRLGRELDLDAARVAKLAGQGALRKALEHYAGPVLPASAAPGIVELRDELAGRLRESMLADAAPDLLLAFAERDEHRYDAALWRALLQVLPARSPRRASVVAHLERIESALR